MNESHPAIIEHGRIPSNGYRWVRFRRLSESTLDELCPPGKTLIETISIESKSIAYCEFEETE